MIFFGVVQGAVHQRFIHHRWLVYRKHFLGLQGVIEKINDNCRERQHYNSEQSVLSKK